jgi:outer membrane immunogenic protein
MYRAIIGTVLAAFIGTSARAADLPPSAPVARAPAAYVPAVIPVYNWTGFYIGLNGGWGFASGNSTATLCCGSPADGASATGSGSINGGIFGGQAGANYQIDAFVFGLEGDWDWSGQSRTDSFVCAAVCTGSETVKISWIATLRGRIGYAIDRVLVYATGGGAWTHTSDNVVFNGFGTVFNASTNAGWTIGGGGEFAFAQNWTAKFEYLYIGTNVSQTGALPAAIGGSVTETAKIHDSLIRAGINFKFP